MFFWINKKIKALALTPSRLGGTKATKTKNQLNSKKWLMITLLAFFVFWPLMPIFGRTFNPHNIFSDQELLDKDYLSKTAIQTFLERENSVLANFSQNVGGETKSASQMIWEISQKEGNNPAFLLTVLEKEQGLIHRSNAPQKALDWATGYSCYASRCNDKYKGFYDQIDSTAITQKIYISQANRFPFKLNAPTKTFDGYTVIPQNQATASLYIYTPYVGYAPELGVTHKFGGNKLFWQIWNRYFTYRQYPNGVVLKNNDDFWLIQKDQKRKFKSKEIFLADQEISEAVEVDSNLLAAYPDGPEIAFTNNSLVRSDLTGQTFLLTDFQKRPIIDDQGLAMISDFKIAVSSSEIPTVPHNQLQNYSDGNLISAVSIYPQGKLLKDKNNTIYWVQDNLKHLVYPEIWQLNFKNQPPELTDTTELEKYPLGAPVKIKDGALVKNDNKYYLISDGGRIRIEYPETLNQIFSQEKINAATLISKELLEIHPADNVNIAYANTAIKDSEVTNIISPTAPDYQATFLKTEPESLEMLGGENKTVKIYFQNSGTADWQKGKVWLKVSDADLPTSSFLENQKNIDFKETSVGSTQTATFILTLKTPQKIGLMSQNFQLDYKKEGQATELLTIGKFILIKEGSAAKIISHNLPLTLKNTSRPTNITIKIKNTSKDTWLAKKTALEIYNFDGTPSPFFDPNDWVKKEVAAVPINKSYIKPGETATFKFTLKSKGLKAGDYTLKIKLNLRDKNKFSLLDDKAEWLTPIKVSGK